MYRRLNDLFDNVRFLVDLAGEVLSAVVRRPTPGGGFRLG